MAQYKVCARVWHVYTDVRPLGCAHHLSDSQGKHVISYTVLLEVRLSNADKLASDRLSMFTISAGFDVY